MALTIKEIENAKPKAKKYKMLDDQRHYAPLHVALPNESAGYEWRRETGDIQSYQHNQTAGWLHIDPQAQAQSLVGDDEAFREGLRLRDFADRKSEVPGEFGL